MGLEVGFCVTCSSRWLSVAIVARVIVMSLARGLEGPLVESPAPIACRLNDLLHFLLARLWKIDRPY